MTKMRKDLMMETLYNRIMILAVLCAIFVTGLVLLSGCKKSQPQTNTTNKMSDDDMANMSNHANMTSDAAMQAAPNGQTICPVMGEPIDLNVFVEYQGKKVYFCCDDCKEKFLADPEKYIAKLPQFAK